MAERKPRGLTLTFTEDELDVVIAALSRLAREEDWDEEFDDAAGTLAATMLDRIASELPAAPAGPAPRARKGDGPHHGTIRKAIHSETKLALTYVDRKGTESRRIIWPLELGFAGAGETIGAWCESRRDFRHFRLDRIVTLEDTGERYPQRRRILLAQLQVQEMEQGF